jgi:hypothetical protein
MVFWGIKKKKKVPDELPDLISDDIEKNSKEVNNYLKESEKKKDFFEEDHSKKEEKPLEKEISQKKEEEKKFDAKKEESRENNRSSKEIISRLIKNIKDDEDKRALEEENSKKPVMNKSFFDELQKNLSEEIGDLDNLENWFEKKFMPRDILSDMREYWEKQKTESVLELLGKNFQEKIESKISKLQDLEKDWQTTYFELIEKEEEIKNQEAELKEFLKEFVDLCKNKKKSLNSGKKEEKKNEEKEIKKE